jgi:nucleotidyltransferase/DNA polymerase involved in DNA repair
VLYCTIPHFAAALARRDDPGCEGGPLVLIGPEERVFDVSADAQACGVVPGMTARTAQVRCPEAHLLEADVPRCRKERETLLQLLEEVSPEVEPHGWGAAYVDLGDLVQDYTDAVTFCREVGRQVRRELGKALQPALGWDSSKFTAQTAGRRTHPGHLQAVDAARERDFLQPLPVSLLPLAGESLQRLCFLGLRTLGQYAALPRAAVWQQFGRAGRVAHRCARGEDDRPIVSRWHAPQLAADIEFETPLVERERLLSALERLLSPLLAELQGNLQACGQVRLAVRLDDGSTQERERAFLFPLSEKERIVRAMGHLLDGLEEQGTFPRILTPEETRGGIAGLAVALTQIQDAVAQQLTLFPLTDGALEDEKKEKLREVERYLAARFGASPFGNGRLRRAVMAQPGAPLPEWRVSWQAGDGP